ncbi:LuxR family transcriptional regulator [Rhizobium bangladeshense]|uniref:LuxR family transcriptional regulator n=1 Tax=Rhizobium bangladeshense TaxID=1138189 RepID=A0ABS7LNV3_9HYPH|nr:LuxR family transcriptional regulator [Rhizobium bangladeshense]MBX4867445.1 LuxR family transcriptional regulator [Rhizobium bangladeshense]MBX4871738.1 LuxR family transcriptional regulator [Rhizobium bangladeshense]MBX4883052.1 LuxR family transcriptional regulator [Rhizobium bangladeshense]MBX4920768.1 LuxR family transcriptional regulator [Rhizobium bangladeshense]MBY3593043.1 LuxR family transcriptional regulator [Rhizobium bangladeshense]
MLSSSRFFYSLDRISASPTMRDLEATLDEVRHIYAISHMVLHVTRSSGGNATIPLLMLTYPPEWVKQYLERDYFSIDPVVRLGRCGFLPVEWSASKWDSGRVHGFFKEAMAFGVGRQGVTLPVRGPRGERSLFTVTSTHPDDYWRQFRMDSMRDLQYLAHHLHDRAMVLSGMREAADVPQLSRREVQCLEMTANGLLAKQIGARLSISLSAVQLYLASARRKLTVATTSEAVAKAIALELI